MAFTTHFVVLIVTLFLTTVKAISDKECYNPNVTFTATFKEKLDGVWYEEQRTSSHFEPEGCGNITFRFSGDDYSQLKFHDSDEWIVAQGFSDENNGEMSLGFESKSYTSYLMTDENYPDEAIIYACCGKFCSDYVDEQVWILKRHSEDIQMNWAENGILQQHARLVSILSNSTACSVETTVPSEDTTTEELTSPVEDSTIEDGTTPKETTDSPPRMPGFHIPNSDKTFYFACQLKQSAIQ